MITAVDTNVLLDVFLPDPQFLESSRSRLRRAYDEGSLVICSIVYAELAPRFQKKTQLDEALDALGVTVGRLDEEMCFLAGDRWRRYRASGGKRERIISDFLIAAHAVVRADRFLTRDRGFYKTYFPRLARLE